MDFLIDGPKRGAKATYLFAHGAGAPMDSDFMNDVAALLAQGGIRVVRFEFPYMAQRRTLGKKRPPDRQAKCLEVWHEVIQAQAKGPTFIGGKSMGGRMASHVLEDSEALGLIVWGFPFHAPGKLDWKKADHLKTLKKPSLILQGERDAMGTKVELSRKKFGSKLRLHFLSDGDHSLKPRKKSGITLEENLEEASQAALAFMGKHL